MPKKLRFCKNCKEYTMEQEKCPSCGGPVVSPHPPKYSPHDKYQKYRLEYFKEKFAEKDIEKDENN